MRIMFLGGAEEIGASSALLSFDDGPSFLIDCGQRLGAQAGQELPDLALLEGREIGAILLTHAHTDHVGGLPALEPYLDDRCPIFATEATRELTRCMLTDTVRIMSRFRNGDGQQPLFPTQFLERTLARMTDVRWGKPVSIGGGAKATYFPAGHLLGAAMIEIRRGKESVLFTGDLSVTDQATVVGAFVPAIQPQVVVMESTYGGRMHAHRPTQERKIVDRVRETLANGGHVLFPTFALGRAQEVLSILGQAMRKEDLPKVEIYADGLVREVTRIYGRLPHDLSPRCRRIWEDGDDPFFPEEFPIRPIRSQDERTRVAAGGPCVVVSSSGMLQGGASQYYATRWISKPENLILITGYQDEESPGEALLNLARLPSTERKFFRLAGVHTEVACRVESFSLSAHADCLELVSLAEKLRPESIFLVHGDRDARESLAEQLIGSNHKKVILPMNGEEYEAEVSLGWQPPQGAAKLNPLALWPPWDPLAPRDLDLGKFHHWLTSLDPAPQTVTLDELAQIWKTPATPERKDYEYLQRKIADQSEPYFVPDSRRPFLLFITPRENLYHAAAHRPRLSVEQTIPILKELFSAKSSLKYGFYPEEGTIQIGIPFPAWANRLAPRKFELERRTGWRIEWKILGEAKSAIEELLSESLEGANYQIEDFSEDEQLVRIRTNYSFNTGQLTEWTRELEHHSGFKVELIDPIVVPGEENVDEGF